MAPTTRRKPHKPSTVWYYISIVVVTDSLVVYLPMVKVIGQKLGSRIAKRIEAYNKANMK